MDVKIIIIYFKKKIDLNIFFIEKNFLFFLSILEICEKNFVLLIIFYISAIGV